MPLKYYLTNHRACLWAKDKHGVWWGNVQLLRHGAPFHEEDRPSQGALLQEGVGPPLPNAPYGDVYSIFQVSKPKVNFFLEVTSKLTSLKLLYKHFCLEDN